MAINPAPNYKNNNIPGLASSKHLLRLVFILTTLLTGCVTLRDPESSQEYRAQVAAVIQPGQPVGQTFQSRRPRLNGIQLWLQITPETLDPGASLSVELYHNPGDVDPLISLSLSSTEIQNNYPVSISFSPINDPPNQGYYLLLKSDTLSINIYGRDEDNYPNGELWVNGIPGEGDIGFRLSYEYGFPAIWSDLIPLRRYLWLILPLLATLWLPGHLLLNALLLRNRDGSFSPDWGERTAISIALSMAVIPLLMLWTSLFDIRWSPKILILVLLLFASILIWQNRAKLQRSIRRGDENSENVHRWVAGHRSRVRLDLISLSLFVVFLLTLGVRLAMVRDLAAPAWVDSVHHAILTRIISEGGTLPDDYQPYLESTSANYHPGLHVSMALFHWYSGLDLQTTILVFCQVLNALCVFAAYLFTTTIARNRLAGLFAAIFTGFFTPMPAYFASWGRYTQLAGLLVLPACLALVLWFLQVRPLKIDLSGLSPPKYLSARLFLGGIALSGLFLIHYRVTAFLICLILAVLISQLIFSRETGSGSYRQLITRLALLAGLFLLLISPWLPRFVQELFIPWFDASLNTVQGRPPFFADFSWGYLTSAMGNQVLFLSIGGLMLGIFLRRRLTISLPLWVLLMFFLANLGALGLPGSTFVNNTSVEISLFLPLACLAGFFIGWPAEEIMETIPFRWRWLPISSLAVTTLIVSIHASRVLLPILNPITFLFRQADQPALAWIEKNIPQDETILINSFAWGYGIYAGNDGGYWIAPLSGRKTLPPSALFGFSNAPGSLRAIVDKSRSAFEKSSEPQQLYEFMRQENLHFIYIGVRGGPLSPRNLLQSALFQPVYQMDDAWILQRTD